MPIQFQCSSCRSTLQVPDNLAGRKVRCPKCRGVADVIPYPAGSPAAAVPAPVAAEDKGSPRFRADQDEVRVRARKPAPVPEPEVEDAEEVEERPARPIRSGSRRQEAISTRPLRRNEPTDVEDEEEKAAREASRPRRFKRRRRRPQRSSSGSGRAWFWVRWVVAAGIYIVIGSGIAIHMVATGHVEELIFDAISWAVMMPISLFLFFISMFIGSAIAGGIDFGDVRTAIPKAIFLLAPINAFYALFQWYIGFFAAAPFWIFGLMFLFELDIWESWFMVVINWFLNVGANVLTVLIVIAMLHGAQMERDKSSPDPLDDDPIGAAFQMQKDPPKGNQRLRR